MFVAMNGAWLINSAMILMAAVAFVHTSNLQPTIQEAYHTLGPLFGRSAAVVFAVALLCSGLSSSTVGVMAGQVIIEGFLDIKFPIFLRRAITVIPAITIIATGLTPLKILVLSQVVLSFALPFALDPAADAHQPQGCDADLRQRTAHPHRRMAHGHRDHRAERHPAGPARLRLLEAAATSTRVASPLHAARAGASEQPVAAGGAAPRASLAIALALPEAAAAPVLACGWGWG